MNVLLMIFYFILILIGIIAAFLIISFFAGSYSAEYGEDVYEKKPYGYTGKEIFFINGEYELVTGGEALLPVADRFNSYIEKIIGVRLPVRLLASDKPYIELRTDENVGCSYSFEGDNRNIIITADTIEHLLRGTYAFLEEFGGVRCFTAKMIVCTSDKLFFPIKSGGYSQQYNDYFEMRDTDWISPKDDEYSLFRGFNTDEYRFQVGKRTDDETVQEAEKRIASENAYYSSLGGRTQYISSFGHTFTSDFLNSEQYYDKGLNLDCYALDSKGNRRRDELCLSNPKTLEIVTAEVFDMLENKREGCRYDPSAPLQIISLTQADDLTGCKCDDCVKCAKKHGGYSAPNLLFVNKVAERVKAAGYDNVAIDTFAYRYTRSAPSGIVPMDNVIIRLCTIECCCSHYIDDRKCKTNKAFMKDLSDWNKICDRIYIWDYCTDFAYFSTLFPDFETLAHNIRVYYEHNVKGVYEEGNYTYDKNRADPEFAELRSYVISKVMQNPYCDYLSEMKSFCKAYYGEAGEDMYTFAVRTDRYARRGHLNIYKHPRWIMKCSKSELTGLNELFEHAKSVTSGEQLQNVLNSEISWRYYKMYRRLFEFSKPGDFEALREHLIRDIALVNTGRMHEVDSMYKISGIAQGAMIAYYPFFDAIAGKFVYGP